MSKTGNFAAFHAALLFAEQRSRAEQYEQENRGRDSRAEVPVENALQLEEDEGVLRLLLFQAALKKRRILELKG
jgi:hypothetical protein